VIVVDASALAKYVLKEEGWREIRKLLEGGAVSVDHVVKEVSNAIWRKHAVLKLEDAEVAVRRYELLVELVRSGVVALENELKYLGKAFRIAIENEVTVYDALYVAQALELGARLLTSDRKQADVATKLGVNPIYTP
jgi:predicted nucleic acid-binding protein